MCLFTDSTGSNFNGHVDTVINIENFSYWETPVNSSRLQIHSEQNSSWMITLLPLNKFSMNQVPVKLTRLDWNPNDLEVRLQIGVRRGSEQFERNFNNVESWKISFPSRSKASSCLTAGINMF